jgi:hypothetical protein
MDRPFVVRHISLEQMDEDTEKREIEAMPVVRSVSFRKRLIKQATVPTSGALHLHRMEAVARSRWGPSACRANIPHCLTAYVGLDNNSSGITVPPASLQRKIASCSKRCCWCVHISYWCLGDSALAVFILVALIKTLGLTELVNDAVGSRKQKEAETNAKIVDEIKN